MSVVTHVYPAMGWLPEGAHFDKQRSDQGEDFATNWRGIIQAPGAWHCTGVASDRPFPNGFGPDYPLVLITSGPFASSKPYYMGHCSSLVTAGDRGHFGHPLARADQGHNFNGTHGGWVELGQQQSDGRLGPDLGPDGHWFKPLLMKNFVVRTPDPPLKFGDSGWRVLGMTSNLVLTGDLPRRFWRFNRTVHGAVVAFKRRHHMRVVEGDRGVVDLATDVMLQHAADWCRKHKKKEVR